MWSLAGRALWWLRLVLALVGRLLIVVPTGDDGQIGIVNRIHQAMGVINAARPKAAQVAHQRLKFADTLERVTPGGVDKGMDALEGLFVLSVPILVGGPCQV